MDPCLLTIEELATLLARRELSPVELVKSMLERIATRDERLNAYITVTKEIALEQARQAEREIAAGSLRGPLHGIPYAAKDLCFTAGIRTTAGAKIHSDFVPSYDASVVRRLREAGAVLIGKANLHENAYGITSTNPHFGAVRNPWDPDRIPGGSSGGSSAALAAGLCSFSLGSDTGGSIRIPAAFCGVNGLKPTFGRVSRHGVFPLGHTLDHVGPFTLTAADAWLVLAAMSGRDSADRSTVERPLDPPRFPPQPDLKGRRIGVPLNFYFDSIDAEVDAAVRKALADLESLGADLIEIETPDIEEMNTIARLTLLAEATSVHVRTLDARPEDYGADQVALLDQGRFVTAVDYLNAQRRRRELNAEFQRVMERVDVLAAPAVAVLPARIGETTLTVNGEEHDVRLMTTRNARALNLTGLPILTLPCGFSETKLPIGLQLVGNLFDEKNVLEVGHAYQHVSDWHQRRPPICSA